MINAPAPTATSTATALPCETMSPRIELFEIAIDRVTLDGAVARLADWIDAPRGVGCRYVVTPNLDHVVQLRHNFELRAAYAEAGLVLADGWPLVAASRMFGKRLPERVAGSDLVPALLDAAPQRGGLKVFLLGGMPGVGERAAQRIAKRYPAVEVSGIHSPPWGFEHDPCETDRIVELVAKAEPDLLVVGLGAPKQELWLHRHYRRLPVPVAIAAGATIDFLAGVQTRAPRWMQRSHLEWLHRAASDPRRLTARYVRDGLALPGLLWGEWRRS
ncbi:Putative N-acetylmannosaminyltransferase [Pirellulimonas nuda]|uniref:N-acetylmannosaminyltransferase n=1 Tax=Pirellulimonas nuda TaxID=2528009 RepID=A0A518DCW4_9BACT|nr:WecB/TagA/CpsF family glycosyltransferase [Pirellulimonas nuda]QDU89324.1 Putative N-acetylmannosaminyltransferase [Pirellulimonas nuda]